MGRPGRKRNNQISKSLSTQTTKNEKDMGTPELQKKRRLLTQQGNPEDTSDALGVLFSHGIIDEKQRKAGTVFMICYFQTFGKPFATSGRYEEPTYAKLNSLFAESTIDLDQDKKVQDAYKRADDALKKLGRRVREVTKNAAIFDRTPSWVIRSYQRPGDEHDKKCLLKGLDVLADEFGIS